MTLLFKIILLIGSFCAILTAGAILWVVFKPDNLCEEESEIEKDWGKVLDNMEEEI